MQKQNRDAVLRSGLQDIQVDPHCFYRAMFQIHGENFSDCVPL